MFVIVQNMYCLKKTFTGKATELNLNDANINKYLFSFNVLVLQEI